MTTVGVNLVPRAFPLKIPTHFLGEKPWGQDCVGVTGTNLDSGSVLSRKLKGLSKK